MAAVRVGALIAVLEVDLEGGVGVLLDRVHVVGQQVASLRLLLVVAAEPVLGSEVLEVLLDLKRSDRLINVTTDRQCIYGILSVVKDAEPNFITI